jgi:hypothetical protein
LSSNHSHWAEAGGSKSFMPLTAVKAWALAGFVVVLSVVTVRVRWV